MIFACELMDLCRGTQEVEAVLSEGSGGMGGSCDPLARLKMAMEYEEKKVCIIMFICVVLRIFADENKLLIFFTILINR